MCFVHILLLSLALHVGCCASQLYIHVVVYPVTASEAVACLMWYVEGRNLSSPSDCRIPVQDLPGKFCSKRCVHNSYHLYSLAVAWGHTTPLYIMTFGQYPYRLRLQKCGFDLQSPRCPLTIFWKVEMGQKFTCSMTISTTAQSAVYNHWTGPVDWTGGLNWWTHSNRLQTYCHA